MNKPKFGKWTRVQDGLPKTLQACIVANKTGCVQADWTGEIFLVGLTLQEVVGVEKWMPLPDIAEDEDAFTELRNRLDSWEEFLEFKHPDDAYAKALIAEIREVIE